MLQQARPLTQTPMDGPQLLKIKMGAATMEAVLRPSTQVAVQHHQTVSTTCSWTLINTVSMNSRGPPLIRPHLPQLPCTPLNLFWVPASSSEICSFEVLWYEMTESKFHLAPPHHQHHLFRSTHLPIIFWGFFLLNHASSSLLLKIIR